MKGWSSRWHPVADPSDPLGAGREPVGRAGPGQRAVRPARLQHHLPGGGAIRRRALQPHHHRHRRRGDLRRADHQAAVQAGQRGQDHRAAPVRRGRARAAAGHRGRRPRQAQRGHRAGRRLRRQDRRRRRRPSSPSCWPANPTSWTTSRTSCDPTGSPNCSAPAGWRCPGSTARRPPACGYSGKAS